MTSFLGRYETVHAANVLQNSRTFGCTWPRIATPGGLRLRWALARLTLCSCVLVTALSADEAKQLVTHCTILLFKDGERLLTQGERGHFLFILLEGVAKIVVTSGGKVRASAIRQPCMQAL